MLGLVIALLHCGQQGLVEVGSYDNGVLCGGADESVALKLLWASRSAHDASKHRWVWTVHGKIQLEKGKY